MSWQQRGMYLEMLLEQADKGALPDCPRACADLLGGTPDEWLKEWPALRRKFVDRRHRDRDGGTGVYDPNDHDASRQIINLRMARVLKERREYKKSKEIAGRNGGRAKAQKTSELKSSSASVNPSSATEIPSTHLAKPSPLLFSSPLVSVSSPLVSSQKSPPAEARSNHPVYRNGRFVVFDWQFDDLRLSLGPHFDEFLWDEWFLALANRLDVEKLAIDKREMSAWIYAETMAEAKRRGIVLAAPKPPSKDDGITAESLAAGLREAAARGAFDARR
jgi:hypothetical protein